MAKKKIVAEESRKAILVMPSEEFKTALEQRIEEGKKLFDIKVTRNTSPYGMRNYGAFGGGYVSQEERQYNKQEIELFKKEFYKWSDYNSELLKQAFDYPENEYQREYDNTGVAMILMGNEDVMEDYYNRINKKIAALERLIDKLPLLPKAETANPVQVEEKDAIDMKKVFIVHGHNNALKIEVARTVEQMGLKAIILHEQEDLGNTIIEKFESNASDIGFAIVLLTADDMGVSKRDMERESNEIGYKAEPRARARQNVVFEMGYFIGKLDRAHVFELMEPGVEKPGDLDGIIYTPVDSEGVWKYKLAKRLDFVGYSINMKAIL